MGFHLHVEKFTFHLARQWLFDTMCQYVWLGWTKEGYRVIAVKMGSKPIGTDVCKA